MARATRYASGYSAPVSSTHLRHSAARVGACSATSRRELNPSPDRPAHSARVSMRALMVDLSAGAPHAPHPARSIFVSQPIPHSAVGSIVLKVSDGGEP